MLHFYQNLPTLIDPIAFSIGSFSIRWYSLMYLIGLVVTYCLLAFRIKLDFMQNVSLQGKKDIMTRLKLKELVSDFLSYAILGMVIGGRIGYVIFYNPGYYWDNPKAIFWPFDIETGGYVGIYGMSYFGGLIGIVSMSAYFCWKKKINFWQWADFIIPVVPAGYFLGRVGNFINGELYGKTTELPWGMYFEGVLRHPNQLYEAFFEGLVLFTVLWKIRNKSFFPGFLMVVYLAGYGFFRFWLDFYRETIHSESHFFGFITISQLFSLIMVLGVFWLFFRLKKRFVEKIT